MASSSEARRSPMGFFSRNTGDPGERRPLFVQLPGLWKAMIITSFAINLILIAVLVGALFFIWRWQPQLGGTILGVRGFAKGEIGELRDVVQQLQAAHIKTTIPLNQPLPLKGLGVVVNVNQEPTVTLVDPVQLSLDGADIDLGNGNRLHANNISLVLPKDTPLKIKLNLQIPLDDVTIPIKLDVPVDIAMANTELAPQFMRLGHVVDRLVYPARTLIDMPEVEQPPPPKVPK